MSPSIFKPGDLRLTLLRKDCQCISESETFGSSSGTVVSLTHDHKCEMVARGFMMNEGRDWWIGRLTEKIEQWPEEDYCLHLETPAKKVVFLLNQGDLYQLMSLCQAIVGVTSLAYIDSMCKTDKAYGSGPPEERERLHNMRLKNMRPTRWGHNVEQRGNRLWWFCPGCGNHHYVTLDRWKWNGDPDKPTITPSYQSRGTCHCTMANGTIHFLHDCSHGLAEESVDLSPVDLDDIDCLDQCCDRYDAEEGRKP